MQAGECTTIDTRGTTPQRRLRRRAKFLYHIFGTFVRSSSHDCDVKRTRPKSERRTTKLPIYSSGLTQYLQKSSSHGSFSARNELNRPRPWSSGEELASVCLFVVGCLTSQQQASVSQGRICSDNFTYCHTEIQVADPPVHLTQSQYTDTRPTSPSADPITPGAWQGSHWSANV